MSLGQAAETSRAAAPLHFEVISVKENMAQDRPFRITFPDDGIQITNERLDQLIRQACGIFSQGEEALIGTPGWVKTARFDVEAKVASTDVDSFKTIPLEKKMAMLRQVLDERFHFIAHTEQREALSYSLVPAKGGIKIKEAVPGDLYPEGIKGPNGQTAGMIRVGQGVLTAQGISTVSLANALTQIVGHPVVDNTGIKNKVDIKLTWVPDALDASADNSGPSIFAALEEQLGVRLISQKTKISVLVVDRIEHPSPN